MINRQRNFKKECKTLLKCYFFRNQTTLTINIEYSFFSRWIFMIYTQKSKFTYKFIEILENYKMSHKKKRNFFYFQ